MSLKTRVVVTGCAGYIGSVLCQLLLRDEYEVLGIDAFIYGNEHSICHLLGDKNFSFLMHDVRNTEVMKPFLERADVIIPLAALVGAPACEKNPKFATEVNQNSIAEMLKMLSPHQRVIYPNTNSGYGQTDGVSNVTEEDKLNPISVYGQTKVEAEKMILDHPLGATLRLATVFGPSPRMRFDLLVNECVRSLIHEGKLEVFDPHFKRNFLHVRDAARAFARMVSDHSLTGVYNVGLPNALSKLELAYLAAGLLNMYPMDVVKVAEGEDPDKRNYIVSTEKILGTGFNYQYDLNQGIMDVAGMLSLFSPKQVAKMRNV
jgi:nucleoside-diphosphate-sugar epimerase